MNPMMKSSSEAIDLRPPLTPEHLRNVVSVVDVIADDHVDGAGFSSASTLNRQIKQLRKNPELNSKRKFFRDHLFNYFIERKSISRYMNRSCL